ncbi:MAG TPA: cobalamin-independent methionine synthase II family protein [Solirubrobacteraceae bacterium]|jgi:5-methyltetrahydropteroyltriglutamate--homocysteine methyltransferase
MFTATDEIMLPTTVTGSWPRPRWYEQNLGGTPLSTRLNDAVFREQFLDATKAVVSDQERAGLDIVVNGDYHLDDDLGGQSWALYPLERLSGVELVNRTATVAWTHAAGTLLNEVQGGWRFPPVVDRIGVHVPYEFDKIWRSAQSLTDKPVKIGTISAQTAAAFMGNASTYYDDDKRQLMWDFAELMNGQLRILAVAGCKVIQVEDPMIHFFAQFADSREHVDFLVDVLNREIAGLDDCEVWVHTCWGNPNMQRVGDVSPYAPSFEDFLYRVNCDVWTLEMCDRDFQDLEQFSRYADATKKIAIGIISHRTLQVDATDAIAANIRRCLEHIAADKLVLSSDCGFGRAGFNRLIAYHKSAAMVRAANRVRGELGFEVTSPRNDDPLTQLDIPPLSPTDPARSSSV